MQKLIKSGVFGISSKLNLNSNDMSRQTYEKIVLQALDTKFKTLQSLDSVMIKKEFDLTKFLLRNKLLLDLQKQFDRIDEHVKTHIHFGRRDSDYFDRPLEMAVLHRAEQVLQVTMDDVKDLLHKILKSPTGVFHLGLHNCRLPESF